MTQATEVSPTAAEPPATGQETGRRRRQDFETWSWLFMRVSGLALVFLALVHFALTHIVTDVADTGSGFVAERWANPLWRLFDWALLALALFHGLNGLRWIIDDYVRTVRGRAMVKAGLYPLSLALFAYGSLTIVVY
ncbi:MAG: succinate dehydrogenase hydrophobic membrane anchor subunit [Actinomycetota bacterium]|nr:succinate dehydrogenase hydrophobic membrane anchor subunit [Actinomycetota bacterium]MDQ3574253.1 succinate dehydrogenase hydrophobic membrane anchor subunit [Actinomycetota bacterium]